MEYSQTIQTLLPLLEKAPAPRLVTVTSMAGFSHLIKNEKLRGRFTKEDLTEEELEKAISDFKVRRPSPLILSSPLI